MPIPAVKTTQHPDLQSRRVHVLHSEGLQQLAKSVAVTLGQRMRTSTQPVNDELLSARTLAAIDADTWIVILSVDDERASGLNVQLEELKKPALFIYRGELDTRVGPWCHYGHTPCPACIDSISGCFTSAENPPGGPRKTVDEGSLATLIESIFDTILAGSSPLIAGAVIHHNGAERIEYVLKDPLCPVCSIWSRQPMEALYAQHG